MKEIKKVIIVGGGSSAMLAAAYISNNTKKGEMPIDLVIRDTRLLFSCVFFFIIVFYSFL